MEKKPITTHKVKKEELLLKLREQGLNEIRSRDNMQAHGKFMGMDTFSWVAPKFDALATVLSSFPFEVVWVGSHEQIRCATKYYPEVLQNVNTAIIYDSGNVSWTDEAIQNIENIAGVGDMDSAIMIINSLESKKRVLFFTTEGGDAEENMYKFKEYIGR